MSRLNPLSLSLVFLVLSLSSSAIRAVSDEDKPEATVTHLSHGILPEHEYNELINCNSFGEDAYFLFYCANQALVYILPFDTFYKIDFVPTYDYFTTQARAKYYQENNSLILAFQRDTWIAFFKFEANNSTTTTTKIVQFDLAFEREIIDFFIWREIVFLKGPQGYYFLTEIKRIFESNSSLIQGRYCGMIDSIRTANSPKQERLAIVNNKVIFFSFEDRSIVVNTLSNDASSIRGAVYLIKPAELHPECKTSMDISSNPEGNLISINCGKRLMSFIYNVDPFNLIETIENKFTHQYFTKSTVFHTRYSGFFSPTPLAKEINLSSEMFYAVETFINTRTKELYIVITWSQFYHYLEPSHVLSYRKSSSNYPFHGFNVFTILQNKARNGFSFFQGFMVNSTHGHFALDFHEFLQELPIEQKFVQLGNKYCLSTNHSFCFPASCSVIDNSETPAVLSDCESCSIPQPVLDRCISNYWEIACGTTLLYNVDTNSKYNVAPSRKDQICMELASKVKKPHETCLHNEFSKSCQKNPKIFLSASYEARCQPKITYLSYSNSIKAIQIESHGILPTQCRFALDTDPDQNILIIFHEFEYQLAPSGKPGFLRITTNSRSQRETKTLPHEHPELSNNFFAFYSPGNHLEVEYSHISYFKFTMIKMPASKETMQQFECLACVSPRKKCFPTVDGKCLSSQSTQFRAWTPEKGCFWKDAKNLDELKMFPQDDEEEPFLSCPYVVNTNFCSITQLNTQSAEISLNAEDYKFPLCRQAFTFENMRRAEIKLQIETYEMLFIISEKRVIYSQKNLSDHDLIVELLGNGRETTFEVVFFTMDPISTTRLLNNKAKISLRSAEKFMSFANRILLDLVLLFLKLFIYLIGISALITCCIWCFERMPGIRLDVNEVEMTNTRNPYAKIGFEDKHELSLQLSNNDISELETIGIIVDRSGNKVDKAEAECAVCLEKVESRPHQLYLCGRHYVHIDCFKAWLSKSREQGSVDLCPMRCRTVALEPEAVDEASNEQQDSGTGIESLIFL